MKLLVVVPRGLQAAMLGPYGNRWIDTPNLDILASAGTVFDWHFACHPSEAHAVWRSGQHRFAPAASPDLIAALRAAGVQARLVHDSSRPAPEAFLEGWDRVRAGDGTEATLKKARGQLRELLDAPSWLLWVEFGSLLPPWRIAGQFLDQAFEPPLPPESEAEADADEEEEEEEPEEEGLELLPEEEPLEPVLDPPAGPVDARDDARFLAVQTTYAAAVMQLDAVLGELLDGLPDEVSLLVTSDAGLPLGEHGWQGEGDRRLHEERIHVPLLLLGPGLRAGGRSDALTGSVDIAPTLAALAGASLPGVHGLDLLGEARRERLPLGDGGERALRTADWLLRLPAEGDPALYEKPADRGERGDVAGPRFAVAEELAAQLEAMAAGGRP